MTAREAINAMFRYLRLEQRGIPHTEGAYDDPLPDAIDAMNGALQQMAVLAPLFAVKQQRSVWFRAPSTVAVSGLAMGGMTVTAGGAWPGWAAGCQIALPGDGGMNRIVSVSGTVAALQFPYLGAEAGGTARVNVDCAELPEDVIAVLEPVRPRGSRGALLAAGGREELAGGGACGGGGGGGGADAGGEAGEARYFVESALTPGGLRLRLMLSGCVSTDTVLEFQARTAPRRITQADIYAAEDPEADPGTPLPVPGGFVESVFLPLATDLFFSKPCITNFDLAPLRNQDAVKLVREQAERALGMLEQMRPQGRKPVRMGPGW